MCVRRKKKVVKRCEKSCETPSLEKRFLVTSCLKKIPEFNFYFIKISPPKSTNKDIGWTVDEKEDKS